MVIFVSRRYKEINQYQKLHGSSSDAIHTKNLINNAWILNYDYGKNNQTVWLFLRIPWVLACDFDPYAFLEVLAMY